MGATKQAKGRGDRRQRRQAAPQGAASAGSVSAAGGSGQGCRGQSPLHEITLVSPFPPGRALCERGSGGWGQQSNLKAGSAGDKEGKPPAGCGITPPVPVLPGFSRRAPAWQGLYVPQAVQGRGAGGGSPRQNNLRVSPFPGGEERSASAVGGMGATKQPKGRGSGRQRRQATRRVQRRQGQPAPQGQAPPGAGLRHPVPVPPGFSRRAPVRRGL